MNQAIPNNAKKNDVDNTLLKHKKINVKLRIIKVQKHVSHFDIDSKCINISAR